MIKIIKGAYGYRIGQAIVPKTPNDAPFSLTPEKEKELVERGIAAYVTEAVTASADAVQGSVTPGAPTGKTDPSYNAGMGLAELKAIAKEYGVDASKATSKAKVVEMIDAARATAETAGGSEEDDETPPQFDPEPPVGDGHDI